MGLSEALRPWCHRPREVSCRQVKVRPLLATSDTTGRAERRQEPRPRAQGSPLMIPTVQHAMQYQPEQLRPLWAILAMDSSPSMSTSQGDLVRSSPPRRTTGPGCCPGHPAGVRTLLPGQPSRLAVPGDMSTIVPLPEFDTEGSGPRELHSRVEGLGLVGRNPVRSE